jgi:hypothetical protein
MINMSVSRGKATSQSSEDKTHPDPNMEKCEGVTYSTASIPRCQAHDSQSAHLGTSRTEPGHMG